MLVKIATVLKNQAEYFLDEQRGRVSHFSQDGKKRKQPFEGSPRIVHDEVVRELSRFRSINEVVQSFQVSSDKIQVPKKEKRIFYEFCARGGAVI